VLLRLNGFVPTPPPNPTGGVHVWPAAGGAKQSVDVNDPTSIDVKSSLIVGAEANVRKPTSGANGTPGVWTISFRSRIVPVVLLREANDPVLPVLLTTKEPFGGPTGG